MLKFAFYCISFVVFNPSAIWGMDEIGGDVSQPPSPSFKRRGKIDTHTHIEPFLDLNQGPDSQSQKVSGSCSFRYFQNTSDSGNLSHIDKYSYGVSNFPHSPTKSEAFFEQLREEIEKNPEIVTKIKKICSTYGKQQS